MVFCPKCKAANAKTTDFDYLHNKLEEVSEVKGDGDSYKSFLCWSCQYQWESDSKGDELYKEYCQLKDETSITARDKKEMGLHEIPHLDLSKLVRVQELAKELIRSYRTTLDLQPSDWHEIQADANVF